jgi:hypothetical protein
MSSKFHQKFHRFNHHTDSHPDPRFPDAGHDPIASPLFPFRGDFVLNGSLSGNADAYIGNNLTIQNELSVGGISHFSTLQTNELVVFNTTNLQGPAIIDSSLNVIGAATFNSTVNVVGMTTLSALNVIGAATVGTNLTVAGDLTVQGDFTYLNTFVALTSSLSISNTGTTAALSVVQTGNVPVAIFRDDTRPALFIDGRTASPGWIGIGTENPTTTLHVSGNALITNTLGVSALSAVSARFNLLSAGDAHVTTLSANLANVVTLSAGTVRATSLSGVHTLINNLTAINVTSAALSTTSLTSVLGSFDFPTTITITNSAITIPINSGNRMLEIVSATPDFVITSIAQVRKGCTYTLANMTSATVSIYPTVPNIRIRGGEYIQIAPFESCAVVGVSAGVASVF